MGFRLMQDAFGALEAAPPIGKRRASAAKGSLSPPARVALLCLANAARDETGLAWPSQATLARFAGYTMRTISAVLAELLADGPEGHLSAMPGRAGRVPLYLVHPGGLARYEPVPAQAVRAHLAAGRFSEGEREEALAWLAGMGHIEGPTAAAAILKKTAKRLCPREEPLKPLRGFQPSTPETIAQDPGNHFQGPRKPFPGTPETISDEPINEPINEPVKEPGMWLRAREIAGARAERAQGALRGGAMRADWRAIASAEPREALRQLLAAGDARAERLAEMPEDEALAAVEDIQRTLCKWRG